MRAPPAHGILVAIAAMMAASCDGSRASTSAPADSGTCAAVADASDLACVLHVDGRVIDLAGSPVRRPVVSMCSRECYGAAGADDGTFSIPIGALLRASDYALHVSGRPDFADVYSKVPPADKGAIALGAAIILPALPSTGPALPDAAATATTIVSGDLTLDVPAGATFQLDVGDVALGDRGRQLRVARVPLDATPEFARALTGVVGLYALAPPGAASSLPLAVHLPNAASLPPSSAVDLFVLDDDYRPMPPTAGTARLAAKAHVSADGRTIDTDVGAGIANLTWLVVRRSP